MGFRFLGQGYLLGFGSGGGEDGDGAGLELRFRGGAAGLAVFGTPGGADFFWEVRWRFRTRFDWAGVPASDSFKADFLAGGAAGCAPSPGFPAPRLTAASKAINMETGFPTPHLPPQHIFPIIAKKTRVWGKNFICDKIFPPGMNKIPEGRATLVLKVRCSASP